MRLALVCLFGLASASALSSCSSAHVESVETGSAEPQEAQCALRDAYQFGRSGGMAPSHVSYRLEPPNIVTTTIQYLFDRSEKSCRVALPSCDSTEGLAVADLNEVLLGPALLDVWPASGERLYGIDLRPVDAPLTAITRASGGTILVGAPCRERDGCTDVPPEVQELTRMLGRLADEVRATPECAEVKP